MERYAGHACTTATPGLRTRPKDRREHHHLDRDHLDIRFTVPERVGGLIKDQRVPVAAIRRVELVENPIGATRGWRAPGLAVPGRREIGHWRGRSGHELVAIRRGEPAVRLHLDGHRYSSMLLGTPEAADLAERLATLI